MKGNKFVRVLSEDINLLIFCRFFVIAFGLWVIVVSVGGISHVQAGSLYKWIDENGNVIYQDTPPPSSVEYEEQTYSDPDEISKEEVNLGLDTAAEESPISLYSIPICDACDMVRHYLDKFSLPYTEKDVQNSFSVQQELKTLAGQLNVPVLVVGNEIIDGYSKSAMRKMLTEKGYPLDQLEDSQAGNNSSNQNPSQQNNEIDPLAEIELLGGQGTFGGSDNQESTIEPYSDIEPDSN